MPIVELIKGIFELTILLIGEWAKNQKAAREKREAILRMDELGSKALETMRSKVLAENASIQRNESRIDQIRSDRSKNP